MVFKCIVNSSPSESAAYCEEKRAPPAAAVSHRSQVEVGPSWPLPLRRKPGREVLPSTCALVAILVLEMARTAVMAQRRRVSQMKAEVARSSGTAYVSAYSRARARAVSSRSSSRSVENSPKAPTPSPLTLGY